MGRSLRQVCGSDDKLSASVESNPRIQCENCGRWTRLEDADGNQLNFCFEGKYVGFPGINFDRLCIRCHLLFGIVVYPYEEVD